MKVYEVRTYTCYEFEPDINTVIYARKEDAEKAFAELANMFKGEAEAELDKEEIVIDESKDCIDIYKDGSASEWERSVSIHEKELIGTPKKLYVNVCCGNIINIDERTDEEFIECSDGWCFDSIEEFVESFNRDDNKCPTPDSHYLRLI